MTILKLYNFRVVESPNGTERSMKTIEINAFEDPTCKLKVHPTLLSETLNLGHLSFTLVSKLEKQVALHTLNQICGAAAWY